MTSTTASRVALLLTLGLLCAAFLANSASLWAQSCPAILSFGAAAQCTLSAAAEVDQFTFTAQAGDRLIIRASRTSGTLQPRLRLRTSQGGLVGEAASYSAIAELDGVTLTADDTYTLFLDDRQGFGTGAYAVSMQRLNGLAQPSPMPFGETRSATLLVGGELDAYSLSGRQGDRLFLRMSSGSSAFKPQLRLYQPDGTLVCSGYSYGNTATNTQACQLPVTGAYLLLANEWSEGRAGSYYLFAQRLNEPAAPTAIAPGVAVTGSLAMPGEADSFTVQGTVGDSMTIRMARGSGTVQPMVQLYAPDGTLVCGAQSFGQVTENNACLLPQTGSYTVLAYDLQEGRTGSYGLFVQRLNAPEQTSPLTAGMATPGQITVPGELSTFSFSGVQGAVILTRAAGGQSLSPVMTIYGPGGVVVCSGYSFSRVAEAGPCILPVDGAYTLLLGDFNEARTGTYTLHLQSVTDPASARALPVGRVTVGVLATPGQLDTHTFPGYAGAKLRFRSVGTSQGINPSIRLYAPDGLPVCSATTFGTSVETDDCLLPVDGRYTLIINDFFEANIGGYTVSATCLVATCGPGPVYKSVSLPLLRR